MQRIITVEEIEWVPRSNSKMFFKDVKGKWYKGPRVVVGEVIIAEVTDKEQEDGYYHIIEIKDRVLK